MKPPPPQEIIIAACANLLAKAKAKTTLAPGAYGFQGDVTFHLDCEILKGHPESYVPTSSLPIKSVLAICLGRAGFQRDRIQELILEAATEAMSGDYGDHVSDYIEATEAALVTVQEMLAKLPPKEREGKTTVAGSAILIDYKEAAA